jgi:uncharacterized membrane protein
MVELVSLLRWIHEIAAITWFGEVFVVTHIIVPTLTKLPDSPKGVLMLKLYPRVFRMATISSSATVAAGTAVALLQVNFDFTYFLQTFRGQLIFVGGLVGLFMFLLHTTVERVEMKALSRVRLDAQAGLPQELMVLDRRLRVLPRVGFTLLTIALFLMIYVSHGI